MPLASAGADGGGAGGGGGGFGGGGVAQQWREGAGGSATRNRPLKNYPTSLGSNVLVSG